MPKKTTLHITTAELNSLDSDDIVAMIESSDTGFMHIVVDDPEPIHRAYVPVFGDDDESAWDRYTVLRLRGIALASA